ncbi:MAG: adenine deaminase [Saprospiraceae bacterium]|nr:adenine deaminase [Saprospiraceae bacterium]MDW8230243.1 adenine deaminase [Saprospiraceae bacterium]
MATHTAQLVDVHQRRIYPAAVVVEHGRIRSIRALAEAPAEAGYLLPGFVDAHVHIESSMLPPAEFGRLAVVHGTVATVSDPHEIANVLGEEGVLYMLEEARRSPVKFCFGAPSCVPATSFETAGAALDAAAVERLLQRPDIGYLSEMMNFPGVLHADGQVMAKIRAAQHVGKPVDGHAPGLRGEAARRYFEAGISTDHECFAFEEGREKALLGVRILIREGSAARNFEALWPLLLEFPQQVMFCSDDKHPDDLLRGHIDRLVARAVAKGCDLFDTLRAASVNPVGHYGLPVGLLREGDPADFIRVSDLTDFHVLETYIGGERVAANGQPLLPHRAAPTPNAFAAQPKRPEDFRLRARGAGIVRLIRVWDGQIITGSEEGRARVQDGWLMAYPGQDVLKIAVVNRYADAPPAVGFVSGFGLQRGAVASSVAHDSHNIVAVSADDASLCAAVNAVIEARGGISATDGQGNTRVLPLPIAGLMSPDNGYTLARNYAALDAWTREMLHCPLRAPFMTLSFLALPVIPVLKMTDLGLFDVEQFGHVEVEVRF